MTAENKLKKFCEDAIKAISESPNKPVTFVHHRVELHNLFLKGSCLSTSHGLDVFQNILNCLDGEEWNEDGELGNNFRKLIKNEKKKSNCS